MINSSHLSRRQMFAIGGKWVAAAGVAATWSDLVFPGDSEAANWKSIMSDKSKQASGKVKSAKGNILANGRPVKTGDSLKSGDSILTSKASHMMVSLEDGTIFQVKGKSSFVFNSRPKSRRGIINVALGSLLAVVPTGNRYLVTGPTATIGIKGTVFFRQVFHPMEKHGMGMNGSKIPLPDKTKDMFCLCHGAAEYLEPDSLKMVLDDTAKHHKAHFLGTEKPLRPNPATPINHSDAEIARLIKAQEGNKHDASWLKNV